MKKIDPFFSTQQGSAFQCRIEDFLESEIGLHYRGKVNLILTSPPFPLTAPKAYGNKQGNEYLDWLSSLAEPLSDLLTDDGSIVIEVGNSWDSGLPTMSTLPMKSLLAFQESANLYLAQEFICHNPARLPGPAEWVTKERIRVKDTFTRVWWLSKTPRPKADNRRILNEYSPAMQKLLKDGKVNSGKRPSEHVINETSFLINNGGSIGANVLSLANTWHSDKAYFDYCRENDLKPHPARMQHKLVSYFLDFLTDEGDLVFDPFGGSLTTGYICETQNRRWISTERDADYLLGSKGRFPSLDG